MKKETKTIKHDIVIISLLVIILSIVMYLMSAFAAGTWDVVASTSKEFRASIAGLWGCLSMLLIGGYCIMKID